MIAYHYSNSKIKIGDIIVSNQHKGLTYDLVRTAFDKVTPIPLQFGYAYPKLIEPFHFKYIYEVETQCFIKGNLNYSVFFTMDSLSSQLFNNKTILLKERLNMRNQFLKQQAEQYFTKTTDEFENEIELISDSWVVKDIIKL